jgi:hypothetical protein
MHCQSIHEPQKDMTMTALERRLEGLLQDRKGKGRFRQLREYDKSDLVDFVGSYPSLTTQGEC